MALIGMSIFVCERKYFLRKEKIQRDRKLIVIPGREANPESILN
jgi:hypothetical protein